ncbi:hypothetical protein GQ600_669 [Phytophthora cactorum]|nr:hypothetical protein GQ600_669 [Phytophthora cactorum]
MHQRVKRYVDKTNELNLMINDIQRCDYIKLQLARLNGGQGRAYRHVNTDPKFKNEVEDLFDLPIDEVLPAYFSMLRRRNDIVHKYTQSDWVDGPVPKPIKYKYRFINR